MATKKATKTERPTTQVRAYKDDAKWIHDQAWRLRITAAEFVKMLRSAFKSK